MADIHANPLYQILYAPGDEAQKAERLAAAFNAASGAMDKTRENFRELFDHVVSANADAQHALQTARPDPQSETAAMCFAWGINTATQRLLETLDAACKKSGTAGLDESQVSKTALALETLKFRNARLKDLAMKEGGLKEYLAHETAREAVVADQPVAVRKSPIRLKTGPAGG